MDPIATTDARARVEQAHLTLLRVIDGLPEVDGDTRMATAELDAALLDLRDAKSALDHLVAG
jgi:hypothetical protein